MEDFDSHPSVSWKADGAQHPARLASWRAMNALARKDRDAYLALYAPHGGIEDPVGPSTYDPAGEGHYGSKKLAAFRDNVIDPVSWFRFEVTDSFAVGNEVANVGTVTTALDDGRTMDIEGVFHYTVDRDGLLASTRAFWELDRAAGTIRDT